MEILDLLFTKLIPLYIIMGLGYIAARWLNFTKEAAANLLIYIVAPIVVFVGIARADLQFNHIALPILMYGLCAAMCYFFFLIAKPMWPHKTPYVLAPSCSMVSGLNFGFPIALALFPTETVALFLVANLGIIIFDATIGYYVIARGNYTVKESLHRLMKLPLIYASIGGILFSYLNIPLPNIALDLYSNFEGAQVVVGMMIIGQSLIGLKMTNIDWKYISFSFIAKFAVWPLVMFGILYVDQQTYQLFDAASQQALLYLSILPLAISPIAYATALNVRPEKVASAVFLTTLFSLVYLPFMYMWLF